MKAIIKRLTILAMAILAIGFWGCSNNDVEDKNPVLGKESAYFLFSFTTEGKSLRTTDPVNALPSEVTVNTVDVYVYDGATFERHVSLLFSDFQESTPGSNIWVLKEAKKIGVVAGTKSVYVGINLPVAFNQFRVSNSAFYMNTLDDLNKSANGFAMFSTEVVTKAVATNATESMTIPVGRLLSKVAVHTPQATQTTAGGVFSDLKYDVNNNNKAFFLFQQKSGGYVVDPNYDWSATDYTTDFLIGSGAKSVDQAPADYTAYTNVKYTLENTTKFTINAAGAKLRKSSSYVTLSANFTPQQAIDAAANALVAGVKGKTFYYVQFEGGEVAYVYAASFTAAQSYATSVAAGRTFTVTAYPNGVCYYTIFLAQNNSYDLLRNFFYIVNIDAISVLGNPTPAIDPQAPIESNAYLQVTVDIQPWSLDIQNVTINN